MSLDQIIGGCIAVIVAGLPAMVALLKIKELHVVVNSSLAAFVAATKLQSDERITATKLQAEQRITATKIESDVHFQELKDELAGVKHRNDQLLEQLAETIKRLPLSQATTESHLC